MEKYEVTIEVTSELDKGSWERGEVINFLDSQAHATIMRIHQVVTNQDGKRSEVKVNISALPVEKPVPAPVTTPPATPPKAV